MYPGVLLSKRLLWMLRHIQNRPGRFYAAFAAGKSLWTCGCGIMSVFPRSLLFQLKKEARPMSLRQTCKAAYHWCEDQFQRVPRLPRNLLVTALFLCAAYLASGILITLTG